MSVNRSNLWAYFLCGVVALMFSSTAYSADDWKNRPYLNLGGGSGFARVVSGDDSTLALAIGSEGGFQYSQREGSLSGRTRIGVSWMGGVGSEGRDLRVGTFLGQRGALFGYEVGVDIFENNLTTDRVSLATSSGIDFPLKLIVGPRLLEGFIAFTPTYLVEESRRVDWESTGLSAALGHEMELSAGVAFRLPIVGVSLAYSDRQISGGRVQSLKFGVEF